MCLGILIGNLLTHEIDASGVYEMVSSHERLQNAQEIVSQRFNSMPLRLLPSS